MSDEEFNDAFERFVDDYPIEDKTFTEVKQDFRKWQGGVRHQVSWKQHKQIKRKYEENQLIKDIPKALMEIITVRGKSKAVYRDPFTGKFTRKPS